MSYAGGPTTHIAKGLDLFYAFGPWQPRGALTDSAPGGLYSISGLGTTHPSFDSHGLIDFGFWAGFSRNCTPACDQPRPYTLTTPYNRALGDFTLAVVFAHYPNSLAVNSNETVLDKTTTGTGLRIFRNGSAANSWRITVGGTTSNAFSLNTDVPAGSGAFPMLFIRRSGSSVTVYTTGALEGLPLVPVESFFDSTTTDTAPLTLGSMAGGLQPFYGTLSHLQVWSRALSDVEMVRQAGVVKAAMEARGVTTQ